MLIFSPFGSWKCHKNFHEFPRISTNLQEFSWISRSGFPLFGEFWIFSLPITKTGFQIKTSAPTNQLQFSTIPSLELLNNWRRNHDENSTFCAWIFDFRSRNTIGRRQFHGCGIWLRTKLLCRIRWNSNRIVWYWNNSRKID